MNFAFCSESGRTHYQRNQQKSENISRIFVDIGLAEPQFTITARHRSGQLGQNDFLAAVKYSAHLLQTQATKNE